jgi:hypothetical protein
VTVNPWASLALAAILGACRGTVPVVVPATTTTSPTTTAGTVTTTLVLPTITGVVDPSVTQDNLKVTVCAKGYTAKVRPPKSYTEAIKRKLFKAAGSPGKLADFELDHFVPLELGGDPKALGQFWLQPIKQAVYDDRHEENVLHSQLCAGKITLAEAQAQNLQWKTTKG